jgi:hypothetical protein
MMTPVKGAARFEPIQACAPDRHSFNGFPRPRADESTISTG